MTVFEIGSNPRAREGSQRGSSLSPQDEVLLIQEAKKECRGSWYLPAGRMEPGETIVEALQREVKEEAGLHCEPLTLLSVEERGPSWIRFVFLARATGMAHLVAVFGRGQLTPFPQLVLW